MAKLKAVFFYGGILSQWCPVKFEVDGITYNSTEQFMMAHKALCFKDDEAYEAIMSTTNPAEQKAWGRKVKNFDGEVWAPVSREVVYRGNLAKFTQNRQFKNYLKSTIGKELVEASPVDKIWGIGLSESDPRIHDKSKWLGTNWLGIEIMKVRDTIFNDELQEG